MLSEEHELFFGVWLSAVPRRSQILQCTVQQPTHHRLWL